MTFIKPVLDTGKLSVTLPDGRTLTIRISQCEYRQDRVMLLLEDAETDEVIKRLDLTAWLITDGVYTLY